MTENEAKEFLDFVMQIADGDFPDLETVEASASHLLRLWGERE
jgi:hypothetical protein